jgi:dolichol-phosphate mannosyltransferase
MIFVALPAYNEGEGIASLLQEIACTAREFLPGLDFTVVVVDDGSTDNTAPSARAEFARLKSDSTCKVDFVLLDHPTNRGLAEAVKTGLFYCADKVGPRDVILTMDSDNSHTPGLIPHMVRLIYEGYDVIIASRFRPGARVVGVSLFRRVLSAGASLLLRVLFPIPGVRDYTCGYRAYRGELVRKVMTESPTFISESGFTVMVDVLLKLRAEKTAVLMSEVPLLLRYDQKLSTSKMNVGRTVRQTLSLIWRRLVGLP